MKETMIIYRSFVTAGKKIKNKTQRLAYYEAIFDYGLDQIEPTLDDVADAVFEVVKPLIEVNNKRYENGSKGGRKKKTKTEPNDNQNGTKVEPNVECKMLNVECRMLNEECRMENVFGLFETELSHPLSDEEKKDITIWINKFGEGKVSMALRSAKVQGITDFAYINTILQNEEDEGY